MLEILGFVAADDLAAADRLRDEIVETLRRLARFPEIGRRRPELSVRPGLRFWVVGAYIVVYDSRPRPIEVVRILHGARNLPSILE